MSANQWLENLVFTGTATANTSWVKVPKGVSLASCTLLTACDDYNGATVAAVLQGTNAPAPNDSAPDDNDVFTVIDGQGAGQTADAGEALGGSDRLLNLRTFAYVRLRVVVSVAVPASDVTVTGRINAVYEQ